MTAKALHTYFFILVFCITGFYGVKSQTTDIPPAQFDVIITNSGDIFYGKVVEVGLLVIKYKRTDIPDGPVYEIPRNQVYAISYRNQLREYLSPVDSSIFCPADTYARPKRKPGKCFSFTSNEDSLNWFSNIKYGSLRFGFGTIRNISKVKEVDDYTGEFGLPGLFISYLFPFKKNLDVGLAIGWADFKYSSSSFSDYDMLLIDKKIKETLLSISAAAKYSFHIKMVSPYLIGGVSFINSKVQSEGRISFTEDGRTVLVNGGGRSGSPGLLLRIGAEIEINDNISCYTDFGTGLTLLQVGGVYNFRKNE